MKRHQGYVWMCEGRGVKGKSVYLPFKFSVNALKKWHLFKYIYIFILHTMLISAFKFMTGVEECSFTNAATAKSLQSCLTLCDPIDGSPPGSPVPGILQARILEWVAISFSNVGKWKMKVKSLSRVWLFATPWAAAYQAPLSMGFSRQEYWSGVPLPSPSFTNRYCLSFSLLLLLVPNSILPKN